MRAKKIISGIVTSMLLMNTAIAATSTSYKIDVDSLNGGGNFGSSTDYRLNDTIVGFVDGEFGSSANYTLGSGLVYLELLCGNGIVEFGEACDDGNTASGDGCSSTCQTETITPSAVCGNSIVESGEQCDDGNTASGDGCSSVCTTESTTGGGYVTPYSYHACGNGRIESGEECDDGNTTSGDGCSNSCLMETNTKKSVCGNGIKETGEQCDDGNKKSGDGCSNSCVTEGIFELPVCGNGIKDTGEECDDGNKINYDNCSSQCKLTEKGKEEGQAEGAPVREIRIIAHPEKRVNAPQNWGLTGRVTFYSITFHKIMLSVDIDMNDVGWSTIKTDKLPEGDYIIAFKGRSHLTKIIKQVKIDKNVETIDFSFGGESYLIAGDVHESKDDFVDGLDIAATVKALYTPDIDADLNHDGIVNSLDLSIVVSNLYKTGEKIQI